MKWQKEEAKSLYERHLSDFFDLEFDLEKELDHEIRKFKNLITSKKERIELFHLVLRHHAKEEIIGYYIGANDPFHDSLITHLSKNLSLNETDFDCTMIHQMFLDAEQEMHESMERADHLAYIAGESGYLGWHAEQQFYYETGERDTKPDLSEYMLEQESDYGMLEEQNEEMKGE